MIPVRKGVNFPENLCPGTGPRNNYISCVVCVILIVF